MADVQDQGVPFPTTAAPQQSVNLTQLLTQAQPPQFDPAKLQATLESTYKAKVAAEERDANNSLATLQRDRDQAAKMLKAEGIGPEVNLKWDEKAKSAEYSTDPMQAFGSFASVFAILASSFTRAPMANALNGAAAAMNGIKQRDDAAYKRGFEAFKTNAELALKRQELQHQQYSDALRLMETDATIGRARMAATAAKFDDALMLARIEAGADPEMWKLYNDRQNVALKTAEVILKADDIQQGLDARRELNAAIDSKDPMRISAARDKMRTITGEKLSPEQLMLEMGMDELRAKGQDTPENQMKLYQNIERAKSAGVLERIEQQAKDRLELQGYKDQAALERLEKVIGSREKIAGEREAGAMERLKFSTAAKTEMQKLSQDTKLALAEYLEGKKDIRFDELLTQRKELAELSASTRKEIESQRQTGAATREKERQEAMDRRAAEARDTKLKVASDSLSERSREFEKRYEQRDVQFLSSEERKQKFEQETTEERKRHDLAMEQFTSSRDTNTEAYHKAIIDHQKRLEDISVKYKNRIDQSIINELPNYPDVTPEELGFIQPENQRKLKASFDSSRQIEHIAKYATDNPESVGLLAETLKNINWDAYQGLVQNPEQWQAKVSHDLDVTTDKIARSKGLDETQAAKAKVLNKMLTTQAFTDAAQYGARGGTIYLDRAFREIYQQASNLPTFLDIMRERQIEGDRNLEDYHLGLDRRSDVNAEFPFWSKGVMGTLQHSGGSGIRKQGTDGEYEFMGTDPHNQQQWNDKKYWKKVSEVDKPFKMAGAEDWKWLYPFDVNPPIQPMTPGEQPQLEPGPVDIDQGLGIGPTGRPKYWPPLDPRGRAV